MHSHTLIRGERGMALVLALLALLVVTTFAVILMMTVTVQGKLAGQDSRRQRALDIAEAGVSEAMSRLKAGNLAATGNPRQTYQIFNVAAGSVPVLGADSSGLATSQAAGTYLSYSTPDRDPNALTVHYLTDPTRTIVYKYDSSKSPPINTSSGQPIWEIQSTGTVGQTKRTLVVDVVGRPPTTNLKGGIVGNSLNVHQGVVTCGYNHVATTPDWTAINVGRVSNMANRPGVDAGHTSCIDYETASGALAGLWSSGGTSYSEATGPWGSPPISSGNAGLGYNGPWDAVGMTQADFAAWLPARRTTAPANWNGMFYMDRNATLNNGGNGFTLTNVNGSGFLYVDGDVTFQGDFVWRGMVFINGAYQSQGHIWILGSICGSAQLEVQGSTSSANNSAILYSADAVSYYLAMYGGQYSRIAWREAN